MHRKYRLPLLLLVQIILVKTLSFFPDFVETYYSNGLFVWLSRFSRTVLGNIPFSVGDIIYFVAIGFLVRWFWQQRKNWKIAWKDRLLQLAGFVSVFYFLFHLLWALNYHRVPLFDKMQLQSEYSDADLLAFTKKLIVKTNALHLEIVASDTARVVFPYSQEQVFEINQQGYQNLAISHPYFAYEIPSIKKSIISLPLTYMGFAGYLNPFTNEAQVNSMLPMYTFPATTNHEMAHQIGYASESEANFIGYLASIKNEDRYIQYSGYTLALRYCLRNWEIRDEKIRDELLKTVHIGIRKNFADSRAFWENYESFIESGFEIFYDRFLKLNQQEDGMDSYNKFVDLLVNYYKVEKL